MPPPSPLLGSHRTRRRRYLAGSTGATARPAPRASVWRATIAPMEPCRGCGADLSSDDRFCSQCGQATTSEFEILGAEPPVSTQQVVGRGGRPKGPVVALLALGALAGLVWLVSAWASADDDRPEADELADADEAAEQRPAVPHGRPRPPNAPRPAQPIQARRRRRHRSLMVPCSVARPASRCSSAAARLRRIDLDTGILTGVRAARCAASNRGRWLARACRTELGSDLFAVPVADPDNGERVDVPGVPVRATRGTAV